jgi:cell division protein FtsZ
LFEVNQAAAIIKETAHPDVNLIFGAVISPDMGEEVRITVIATGFERTGMPRRILENPKPHVESRQTQPIERPTPIQRPVQEFQPQTLNTDDLDIPTFLRKRLR